MEKKEEEKHDDNFEKETEKNSLGVIHMGRNLKKLRTAEEVKQITIAMALGYTGKHPQQYINKLEQKPIIEDNVLEIIAPIIKCSVNHIKRMVDDGNIHNMQNYYDYSGARTQNITFNPLEALKEQFEKTQEVYEAYINDQKERISDQKNMLKTYDENMKLQTDILSKLAEKLNIK